MRPLAISTGDPGGVGPEVSLRAALDAGASDALLLYGDARVLHERAVALGAPIERLRIVHDATQASLGPGQIGFVDRGIEWSDEARRAEPTRAGGAVQLLALDYAIEAALQGSARGLVTAPISKAAVTLAGTAFSGHTEHLARAAGLSDDEVTMMFLGERLRVALVTTHLSIAEAPAAITPPRVRRTILHLSLAMRALSDAPTRGKIAKIAVAGINPHAGEQGLFGREELDVIAPAIVSTRQELERFGGGIELHGPLGAETAFRLACSGQVDAVVAMLHDQATIASKLLDWTLAVNVTWGLPFVRTSVDHGVAYDAVLRGSIDARGMTSALSLAQRLTR